MWVLKFRAREDYNIYNSRTQKFGVRLQFFSRGYYEKDNKIYFMNSGIVFGDFEQKKLFLDDLSKDESIVNIEINGDFFISVYCNDRTSDRINACRAVYNPKLFFIKPVIFDIKGFEEYEISSFDRSDLENVLIYAKKMSTVDFELISFREQKIDNVAVSSTLPNFSQQQKKALDLAVSNKYYGYPRQVKLLELSEIMGVSLSTYQFHLAKAEEKIMEFFFNKL